MFFWNSLAFLIIQHMLVIWSLVPLPHKYTRNHWTSHFKDNYIKYKVYLNKSVWHFYISKSISLQAFFKKFETTSKPSGCGSGYAYPYFFCFPISGLRLVKNLPRFDPWVGKIPWRREWQPTPVLLPGEFHGQRSLAGYSPWDCRVRHDLATFYFTFITSTKSEDKLSTKWETTHIRYISWLIS